MKTIPEEFLEDVEEVTPKKNFKKIIPTGTEEKPNVLKQMVDEGEDISEELPEEEMISTEDLDMYYDKYLKGKPTSEWYSIIEKLKSEEE